MLQHAPGRGAAFGLFFETKRAQSQPYLSSPFANPAVKDGIKKHMNTYQHSIKYLKFSLHLIFSSGSSFNLGIG